MLNNVRLIVFALFCLMSSMSVSGSLVNPEETIVLDQKVTKLRFSQNFPTLLESKQTALTKDLLTTPFSPDIYQQSLKESADYFWYRVSFLGDFETDESRLFYFVVKNLVIQHLEFYLFEGDTLVGSNKMGVLDRKNPNDEELHIGPVFEFSVKNDQKLTLLIRKQSDGPAIFPAEVYSKDSLYQYVSNSNMILGGFALFLVIIAFYNSIVGALSRSRSYVWYFIFYLLTFMELSVLLGFGYSIWPLAFHIWLATNVLVINFLLMASALLFASKFLVVKFYVPELYKFNTAILACLLFGAAVASIIPEYYMLKPFVVVQGLGSIYILAMSILAYRRGFLPARFFFLSWMCLLLGAAVGMATYGNVIPLNDFTMHGLMVGAVAELTILSFALLDRYFFSEKASLDKAYTDPQTNLPNYSFFRNRFAESIEHSVSANQSLWMVMFRVKGVDVFTGLLGPEVAPKVFKCFIDRSDDFLAQNDWALPIDLTHKGVCYFISLPGNQMLMLATTGKGPSDFIHDFTKQASKPISIDGIESRLSFSVGLTHFRVSRVGFSEAYRQAQMALNLSESRNMPWVVYSQDQDEKNKETLALLEDLRGAIRQADLQCYLQPQFDSHRRIIGAEALVRWHHHQRGMVSPGVFVPLAEKSGLVFKITQVMIEKVCQWLNRVDVPSDFHVSINLSLLDLLEPQLFDFIHSCMSSYDISPEQVVFEVTETASMGRDNLFVEAIEKLHNGGFRVALDDFGTGHSSLVYMQKMKPDMIKIDMGFVKNIHESEINRKIVRAIVQIAHSTQASTVAEGVETEEELFTLMRLGVDYIQGYLTGKPAPLKEFEATYFKLPSVS